VGVILGGILGHAICTGLAVVGGRHLAAHINEKNIGVGTYIGCIPCQYILADDMNLKLTEVIHWRSQDYCR